jgi:hypothetical protein
MQNTAAIMLDQQTALQSLTHRMVSCGRWSASMHAWTL